MPISTTSHKGAMAHLPEASMAKSDNKKSVYFGEPIYKLLTQLGDGNVSGTINLAVSRYLAMVDESRPILTRNEWLCIADVLSGISTTDGPWERQPGKLLAMEMEDGGDGVFEKWEIDGPALCRKLGALNLAQGLAVLHTMNVIWHSSLPTNMALALAGIIDKDVRESIHSRAHYSNNYGEPVSPNDISEDEKSANADLYRQGILKGMARMKAEKDAKEGK